MGTEARKIKLEEARRSVGDSSYVAALTNKWGKFLEGLPRQTEQQRYTLGVTAILMENQSQALQNIDEETRTVNVGGFTKYVFPVLRRVFPNLIANEIVSVQPMTAPVGAVFFLDYIYSTSKGQTTAGNQFPRDFDADYSSEYVNGEVVATGDGTKYSGVATKLACTLTFNPVRPPDSSLGYTVVIKEIDATTGETVQEGAATAAGAWTGDVTAGSINFSNGSISQVLFTTAPVNGNKIRVYYYYDGELNTLIPSVSLDVKKALVQAESHRLKATWSPEAAEDLRALQGVDAETELVAAMAQEISLEIDRRIINTLLASATETTDTWDRIPPAGINELDHIRSILTKLSSVSGLIHKKTLRAPANFIVTSPEVSALLSQLMTHGDYRPVFVSGGDSPYGPVDPPRPLTQHGQFGIMKMGTLMHKWVLYEDPFFTRNKMLVGLKGANYLDAGFAWAPYIPLQVSASFMDPNDGGYRKLLRTRYASKMLRSQYYGTITVENL